MAKQYNVAEAKAHLSDLLTRVESGEEVMIARAGRPVARVIAMEEPSRRVFPAYPEYDIPDEILDAPLPESELALWE
ncbi:type II toxin-antitoxin system Phd/YefM family antitoxin [Actinomyces timonensis]|jgi:prevent-host-death family protein|uniref:type II toxin-antitoxin system Phd/YefM family antitoxin n=1 Tax=Actinomyces timonensis TaxID=1288391 RepID=UPI000307F801|nr:type II toxin-antitoxin system prevent-host-death family antitoxin [Actinomyces timonensis]